MKRLNKIGDVLKASSEPTHVHRFWQSDEDGNCTMTSATGIPDAGGKIFDFISIPSGRFLPRPVDGHKDDKKRNWGATVRPVEWDGGMVLPTTAVIELTEAPEITIVPLEKTPLFLLPRDLPPPPVRTAPEPLTIEAGVVPMPEIMDALEGRAREIVPINEFEPPMRIVRQIERVPDSGQVVAANRKKVVVSAPMIFLPRE